MWPQPASRQPDKNPRLLHQKHFSLKLRTILATFVWTFFSLNVVFLPWNANALCTYPHPLWGYMHKAGNLALSRLKSKQLCKWSVARCLMHNTLHAFIPFTHRHCSALLLARSIYLDGLLFILLPQWAHCLQQVYLTPWEQKEAPRIQNRCWIDPGSHLPSRSVLLPVNPYALISLT